MLKIQLACKDVIKAGKVKAPGADWATRLLAGNSGAEWRSIAAKLQEGARVGGAWDLAAITLDTGLLDAAAAAIRLARTAKTADPMLTTSLQEFFEVLSTSYSSHVWRVPSLLCTLREAALAGLKPHHLPLYNSVAAFFLVATSALRSGDNKGMYERFFAASDDTAEPSNLLLLLHLGSHAQLGAILFPALNEWTAFFPASITPEEVAKITAGAGETGAAPPATEGQADEGQQGQQSKRRRKDAKRQDGDAAPPGGEAGRGSKRGTLSALFVELQRLRACADLPAGCEFRIGTLFRAFEHSVKASDPLGTVRAFFAPPGESGAAAAAAAPAEAEPSKAAGARANTPADMEAVCHGMSITSLRFFHKVLQIVLATPPSPTAAAVVSGQDALDLTARLLDALYNSGLYRSQIDILYNSGYGFGLLSWLDKAVASGASAVNSAESAEAVLRAALSLLRMYHKVVEPSLGVYIRLAVAWPSATASDFLRACFDVYGRMQALGSVMTSVCSLSGSEEGEVVPLPAGLAGLISSSFTAVIDPSVLLTDVMEQYDQQLPVASRTPACLQLSCDVIRAVLGGLAVTEATAIPVARWIDSVMAYVSKVLMQGAQSVLLSESDDEDDEEEEEGAAPGASKGQQPSCSLEQQRVVLSAMQCYYAAQSVLDTCAPFFLTGDVFVWSQRMVQALQLLPDTEAGAQPVLVFPGMAELTKRCTRDLISSCFSSVGEGRQLAHTALSTVLKILHQRTLRLQKHLAVLSTPGADHSDKAKETAKQLKKVLKATATEALTLMLTQLQSVRAAVESKSSRSPKLKGKDGKKRKAAQMEAAPEVSRGDVDKGAADAAVALLCADLPVFATACSKGHMQSLSLVLTELLVGSSARHRSASIESTLQCSPVHRLVCSGDTWECEQLTQALVSACESALDQFAKDSSVARHVADVLQSFPSECIAARPHLLSTLTKADNATSDLKLKTDLRTAVATLAKGKPEWCNKALPGVIASVAALPPSSPALTAATQRLGVVCMQTANDAGVLDSACSQLIDNVVKDTRGPAGALYQAMLAAFILGYVDPGKAVPVVVFPPQAQDIATIRKKLKKLPKESRTGSAAKVRTAVITKLLKRASGWPAGLLDAALLLASQQEADVSQVGKLRYTIQQKLARQDELDGASADVLLTCLLESAFDATDKHADADASLREQVQVVNFIVNAILTKHRAIREEPQSLACSTPDAVARRVSTDGVEGVLLSRLASLPKRQRSDVLTSIVSGVKKDATKLGTLRLFHVFILTCPKEYETVRDTLLSDAITRVITDTQLVAMKLASAASGFSVIPEAQRAQLTQLLLDLMSCVCAVFLMEKLTPPPAAYTIACTLPHALVGGVGAGTGVPRQTYGKLHLLSINMLNNMVIHRTDTLEWGAYAAAIGDTVDGLLQQLDARRDGWGDLEEDLVAATVRLIELYAGARRRPGVVEAVRSLAVAHSPSLLQRFLLSVVGHAYPASVHNRGLSRAFAAIMSACGKELFQPTYAALPQACRAAAAAYHLQWQSTRFQGKT